MGQRKDIEGERGARLAWLEEKRLDGLGEWRGGELVLG